MPKTPPQIAILTIGSELLDGRTLDTNANFLAKELRKLNYSVKTILTCDDTLEDMTSSLQFCYQQGADLVITSGGMGPTTDDLTREAVALYFNSPLLLDKEEQAKQKTRYQTLRKEYPASNDKQATFPKSAKIIPNNFGTAPVFLLEKNQQSLIALPGVPSELKGIFREQLMDLITSKFATDQVFQKSFCYFGIAESALNDQLQTLNLPPDIEVIYQAGFPELKLHLKAYNEQKLEIAAKTVKEELASENLISTNNLSLPEVIHHLLIDKQLTLAVAESCTGGMLGSILTAQAGSSEYFLGGIISYTNKVKSEELNVNPELLKAHGAVSEEVAKAMAEGVSKKLGSDIGIGITGVAGPEGGTEAKPVGTVWIAVNLKNKVITKKVFMPLDREKVRRFSAYQAIEMVKSSLSHH